MSDAQLDLRASTLADEGPLSRICVTDLQAAKDAAWRKSRGWTHIVSVLMPDEYNVTLLMPEEHKPGVIRARYAIRKHTWIGVRDNCRADLLSHMEKTSAEIVAILGTAGGTQKVLIHCRMGVSRSATVAAAFLIYAYHMSANDALTLLRSRRPGVRPNPSFRRQLDIYETRRHRLYAKTLIGHWLPASPNQPRARALELRRQMLALFRECFRERFYSVSLMLLYLGHE